MPPEEWRAWEATMHALMGRRYLAGYWQTVRSTYGESFARFLDDRIVIALDRA